MEESGSITLGEKQAPVQLSIWDLIESDAAPVPQSTDHTPAAEPVPPAQQPAADPAIGLADGSQMTAATPAGAVDGAPAGGKASDDAATEPGEHEADHETEPDFILPRGAIQIRTGREGMKKRALRVYTSIGASHGLNLADLLAEGDPLTVDIKSVRKLRPIYMAVDEKYKKEIKDSRAGEPVNISREHKRARDRARKEIGRGLSDLVRIYAADEIVEPETGKTTGYRIYRLPEVRRRQLENGVKAVLKRPNGGRIMIDSTRSEVVRPPAVNSHTKRQSESQAKEAVEGNSND